MNLVQTAQSQVVTAHLLLLLLLQGRGPVAQIPTFQMLVRFHMKLLSPSPEAIIVTPTKPINKLVSFQLQEGKGWVGIRFDLTR